MNLSSDPWIPIVWNNGAPGTVSLGDAFLRGRDIRDLAVRPHERIALMRLLLCVAHAALDGPMDRDDWTTCLDRLPAEIAKYLRQWRAVFELLGDGPRFQQWKAASEPTLMSVHKLVFVDKDSATLFNHDATPETHLAGDDLALALLTFQCFAAGGRVEGSADSLKAGLARQGSALHAYIRGESLLETIHANLLTKEQIGGLAPLHWGRPLWECRAVGADELIPSRVQVATGYLSRLAPATRYLWIQEDQRNVAAYGGLSFAGFPEMRDSATTIVTSGNEERRVLAASAQKAPWRELHSLMVRRVVRDGIGGPLAFENLDSEAGFDIWAGGLDGNQAKVDDLVESVFHIPAAMRTSTGLERYKKGVQFAEQVSWGLSLAISSYHREVGDDLGRKQAKERRERLQEKAGFQFWTQAERNVPLLLAAVEGENRPADVRSWSQSDWGKAIRRAAREAYELACPRQTARQMQAFVKGLPCLYYNRDKYQSH